MKIRASSYLVLSFIMPFFSWSCTRGKYEENLKKPNVIVILADDMGYSDIGCYGGEIPTPNIDYLAENGVRFTQFYNTARCCPTRASLLTGLHPHQTGIGNMADNPYDPNLQNWGTQGYIGYLNNNCLTIGEVLNENGYHTYICGKWHLGLHQKDRWPLQRGFEKFYGILSGASSYFKPQGVRCLTYQNENLSAPVQPYYTTDTFTDSAIVFIRQKKDDNPFFLYLAFTAPHWPLHAKNEDIEKFRGRYMVGWDEIRKQRLKKQKELGIFPPDQKLSSRDERVRPWDEVDPIQKIESDYRMATYAAQIYCMDYNIGKLTSYLHESNQLDNTLIIFLSDNGACAEPYKEFGGGNVSQINVPEEEGAVSIGIGWANACNTPLKKYKTMTHEGGISTPFIAFWPNNIIEQAGEITNSKAYLIDLMPTILDATGVAYPEKFEGNKITPIEGKSLVPVFENGHGIEHEFLYWEHIDNCAVRKGDWKAVKKIDDKYWQLFDLGKDRIEEVNLAHQFPEIVKELNDQWYKWAYSHQVLPKK
jgi:arylsulfatase A-like enzyme